MTSSRPDSPEDHFLKPMGAILAGGLSRRMGQDKATLRFQGQPLSLWVAQVLKPLVSELWLVTNFPLEHVSLGLPVLVDLLPHHGPLGGLLTALFFSPSPWVLLAAGDAPLLQASLVAAMIEARRHLTRPALVCRSDRGLEPFPGLYARRLLPRLEEFLHHEQAFQTFLARIRPEVWGPEVWQRFDPQGLSFRNLNQPEDLARLEQLEKA